MKIEALETILARQKKEYEAKVEWLTFAHSVVTRLAEKVPEDSITTYLSAYNINLCAYAPAEEERIIEICSFFKEEYNLTFQRSFNEYSTNYLSTESLPGFSGKGVVINHCVKPSCSLTKKVTVSEYIEYTCSEEGIE